eukprot:403338193
MSHRHLIQNQNLKKKRSLLESRSYEKEQTMHTLLNHLNMKCAILKEPHNIINKEVSYFNLQQEVKNNDNNLSFMKKQEHSQKKQQNNNYQNSSQNQFGYFGNQIEENDISDNSSHQPLRMEDMYKPLMKNILVTDKNFQNSHLNKINYNSNLGVDYEFLQKRNLLSNQVKQEQYNSQDIQSNAPDYFITQKQIAQYGNGVEQDKTQLSVIPKRLQEREAQVQSQTDLKGQIHINASQAINRSQLKSAVGNRRQHLEFEQQKDKSYKICKFDENEMKLMISKSFHQEKENWAQIQEFKKAVQQQPYIENIETFSLKFNRKEKLLLNSFKKKQTNDYLQSKVNEKVQRRASTSALSQRQNIESDMQQKNQQSNNNHKKSPRKELIDNQRNFKNFTQMSIYELKQHEKGILNLYDTVNQSVPQKILHNKPSQGQSNVFDVRLSQNEYDSIFDSVPSFKEKKAFIEVFRKKWKEDKGFCSMFDKRQAFKQALDEKRKSFTKIRDVMQFNKKSRPQSSMAIGDSRKYISAQNQNIYSQSFFIDHEMQQEQDTQIHDINISGNRAKFHKPIQNSEPQNLNEFINSLYKKVPQESKHIQMSSQGSKQLVLQQKKKDELNSDIQNANQQLKNEDIQQSVNTSQRFSFVKGDPNHKNSQDNYHKQIISLPYAKKKNTSLPYSPDSNKNLFDQSQKNLESNQSKYFESEKDQIDTSHQYLYHNKIDIDNTKKSGFFIANKSALSQDHKNKTFLQKTSYGNSQSSFLLEDDEADEIQNSDQVKNLTIKPPIFTLPQNPIEQSHYKYNFVKNKIETNRLQNLSMSNGLQFKLDNDKISQQFKILKQSNISINARDLKLSKMNLSVSNHSIHPQKNDGIQNMKKRQKSANSYVKYQKLIKQRNTQIISDYQKKQQFRESIEQQQQSLEKKQQKSQVMKPIQGKIRPMTSQGINIKFGSTNLEVKRSSTVQGGRRQTETQMSEVYKNTNNSQNIMDIEIQQIIENQTQDDRNDPRTMSTITNQVSKKNSKEIIQTIQDLKIDIQNQHKN